MAYLRALNLQITFGCNFCANLLFLLRREVLAAYLKCESTYFARK